MTFVGHFSIRHNGKYNGLFQQYYIFDANWRSIFGNTSPVTSLVNVCSTRFVLNMEGRHLMVSVGDMPPYVGLIHKNGKVRLYGYLGKIWHILQKRLHFTSEFVSEGFRDGVFYYQNGGRDVILHPSVVSAQMAETFDFTVPVLSSWYYLYIKDSDEANSSASFIRNWSVGLWACTGLMVIIFTVFMYLMLNILSKFCDETLVAITGFKGSIQPHSVKPNIPPTKLRNRKESSLGNCFINMLAAFCSQGCILPTRKTSIRILVLTFLTFGMIMCNSYSALLVSQLTLRERFLPFTTLREIPDQARDYALCVRKDSVPYKFFKVNETSTIIKPRWRGIINRKPCVRGIIPPDVMCAPQIAFLETPAIMRESISHNFKCRITNLKSKYYKVEFTLLLHKNFDPKGKQEINSEIIKYREVGILRHLIKKYVRQDDLTSPAEEPVLQVTFDHVEGVLFAYSCCLAVSFVILLVELLVAKITKYFRKRPFKRKKVGVGYPHHHGFIF